MSIKELDRFEFGKLDMAMNTNSDFSVNSASMVGTCETEGEEDEISEGVNVGNDDCDG